MHKFYWNNTQRSGATSSSVASNAPTTATSSQKISLAAENCQADQYNMDLSAVNIRHGHPEVPARAYGATASIKIGKKSLFKNVVKIWRLQLQFYEKYCQKLG